MSESKLRTSKWITCPKCKGRGEIHVFKTGDIIFRIQECNCLNGAIPNPSLRKIK